MSIFDDLNVRPEIHRRLSGIAEESHADGGIDGVMPKLSIRELELRRRLGGRYVPDPDVVRRVMYALGESDAMNRLLRDILDDTIELRQIVRQRQESKG